jgi:hypothetical protein
MIDDFSVKSSTAPRNIPSASVLISVSPCVLLCEFDDDDDAYLSAQT